LNGHVPVICLEDAKSLLCENAAHSSDGGTIVVNDEDAWQMFHVLPGQVSFNTEANANPD